jgi:hypothetical protein
LGLARAHTPHTKAQPAKKLVESGNQTEFAIRVLLQFRFQPLKKAADAVKGIGRCHERKPDLELSALKENL